MSHVTQNSAPKQGFKKLKINSNYPIIYAFLIQLIADDTWQIYSALDLELVTIYELKKTSLVSSKFQFCQKRFGNKSAAAANEIIGHRLQKSRHQQHLVSQ